MKSMRRTDRGIPAEEARNLLERGQYGVLSTVGSDGHPYGVPLHYVYKNDGIYFHSALSGHKVEDIGHKAEVSFCVVGNTKVLPDQFATEYESAIVFGVVSEVEGAERNDALVWLLEKYSAGFIEEGKAYIERHDRATKVFKVAISHLSGKARR